MLRVDAAFDMGSLTAAGSGFQGAVRVHDIHVEPGAAFLALDDVPPRRLDDVFEYKTTYQITRSRNATHGVPNDVAPTWSGPCDLSRSTYHDADLEAMVVYRAAFTSVFSALRHR